MLAGGLFLRPGLSQPALLLTECVLFNVCNQLQQAVPRNPLRRRGIALQPHAQRTILVPTVPETRRPVEMNDGIGRPVGQWKLNCHPTAIVVDGDLDVEPVTKAARIAKVLVYKIDPTAANTPLELQPEAKVVEPELSPLTHRATGSASGRQVGARERWRLRDRFRA